MALSLFTPSVTGMYAQTHALSTVAENIANVSTTGYKSQETMFYSLLGSQPVVKGAAASVLASSRVDIAGVGYYDRTNILQNGTVSSTGQAFDAAITESNAFFTLKDSGGQLFYTRAGDFKTQTING